MNDVLTAIQAACDQAGEMLAAIRVAAGKLQECEGAPSLPVASCLVVLADVVSRLEKKANLPLQGLLSSLPKGSEQP